MLCTVKNVQMDAIYEITIAYELPKEIYLDVRVNDNNKNYGITEFLSEFYLERNNNDACMLIFGIFHERCSQ